MRARKRIISFMLAWLMIFSAAPEVFAGTFSVGTSEQLATSWESANNNSDTTNTFNMTNDIDMGGQTLVAEQSKDYIINGNGYTLSDVSIAAESNTAAEVMQPDVVIHADITSEEGNTALEVTGTVDLGVDGDVTATSGGTAVSVSDGADVLVGNVTNTDGGYGITASEGAIVHVSGDITLESDGTVASSNSYAIIADDSIILVDGNVSSDMNAVSAYGEDTNVTVMGDVTAQDSGLDHTMTIGFMVGEGASLEVRGDVTSHGYSYISGVTGNGSGTGTVNTEDCDVVIKGNYTSEESGLRINNGNLTVNGDLNTNDQVTIENQSTVKVGGDFNGQPATGVTQYGGIYVVGSSSLTMDSDSTLVTDQLHISGNSLASVGDVEANAVTVGIIANDMNDTSQLLSNDISCDSDNTALSTGGSSYTRVNGNTDSIYAKDHSRVDVIGTANAVQVKDYAKVITNIGNSKAEVSTDSKYNTPVSDTKDDVLVELSKEYNNTTSTLSAHLMSLEKLRQTVQSDVNALASLGKTIGTIATQFVQVTVDAFTPHMRTDYNIYDPDVGLLYHPDSLAAYEKTIYTVTQSRGVKRNYKVTRLNHHAVNSYRRLLADTLEDTSTAIRTHGYSSDELLFLGNLALELAGLSEPNILKGAGEKLIIRKGHEKLTESDKNQLINLYRSFLSDFSDSGESFFKDLTGALDMVLKLNGDPSLDFTGDIFTSIEFMEYWAANYAAQVNVLDYMLEKQPMSAEMFFAAAELRTEYTEKSLGTYKKIFEVAVEKGISIALKTVNPTLNTINAGASPLIGKFTGLNEYYAAVCSYEVHKTAYEAYDGAIKRVQAGDHSDEAIDLVYATFSMYKNALETMCDAMIANGNKQQKADYQNYKKQLAAMSIGELLAM